MWIIYVISAIIIISIVKAYKRRKDKDFIKRLIICIITAIIIIMGTKICSNLIFYALDTIVDMAIGLNDNARIGEMFVFIIIKIISYVVALCLTPAIINKVNDYIDKKKEGKTIE